MVPGGFVGVDVFFVVSGFLITGLIIRELESSGSLSLSRFYARRARRLLPAAVLTTLGTLLLTYFFLPQIRWNGVGRDATWASLYVLNWRYSALAIDYLASEESASPLQHYWSLAVEEQFYLAWPLFLVIAWWISGKLGLRSRTALMVPVAAVTLISFTSSVVSTVSEPRSAYFVSNTRLWELAVGGGLAIAAPLILRLPKPAAEGLAWGGLLGIGWAATQFGAATPFPGYAALLPVLATAAVLAAGVPGHPLSSSILLEHRSLVAIGGLSYSLYLWHWPILITANALVEDLSVPGNLLFVLVSLAMAWLSSVLVEQPIRKMATFVSPPIKGLALGVTMTLIGLGAGFGLLFAIPDADQAVLALPDGAHGARVDTPAPALDNQTLVQETAAAIVPDPLVARLDLPDIYAALCHKAVADSSPDPCVSGAKSGPIVAIVGDSHAAQWVPALQAIAQRRGFQLYSYTKSSCPLADISIGVGQSLKPHEECTQWNLNVLKELFEEIHPDLVLVSSAQWIALLDADGQSIGLEEASGKELALAEIESGLESRWAEIIDAGIPLAVIRDTPRPSFDVAECVGENRQSLQKCAFSREQAMEGNTAQLAVATELHVPVVDVTDWLCSPLVCPAVIDGSLVWRDSHHLTASYSHRLSTVMEDQLQIWPS